MVVRVHRSDGDDALVARTTLAVSLAFRQALLDASEHLLSAGRRTMSEHERLLGMRRLVAERMQSSLVRVDSLLSGLNNPSVATLARVADLIGMRLEVRFVPKEPG